MKTFRYLRLLVLLALGAGVTASAAFAYGPKPKCPSGMDLVAKFEWKGSGYDFEKPSGNEGLVSLSGDAESASWTSQVDIDVVVLKGAKDSDVIATTDPRAGSFTNENLETPSGQQADISNVQFCAGETPPPPPPGGDCVECGLGANDADKVGELTLRYMGPDGLVEVYDNNKVGSRDLLFSEWLETGDEFTVRASAIGKDSFKSKIGFYVDGEEVAELHTSCSAPIVAGLTEATQPKAENPNGTVDVEIVGGKDKQGRELCDGDTPPPPPPPPGDDCVECGFGADDADKVSELTFEYSGTAGTVRVYDNDKTEAGDLLFEGFLNPGDTFTIMASTIGEDSFSSKVGFYLDGTSDSDKIAEIHTSCSSPVGFGTTEANQPKGEDPNGSVDVTVLSGKDKQGRELCDIPPPPPPGDDCVECGFGANDASRISELTLRYLGPEAYITVYDHKVSNGDVLFEGVLSPGEVFTVYASTIGEDRIGPKILLFAGDVQLAEIHTSCSAPVTAGLTEQTQPKAKDPNGVADFEIAGGRDSQGRLLCGSDICLADQGPPQISYAFDENSEGSFVVVTVTDDTGIASVDIEVEDIAGGTPNLELVEEDFTEGAMEATFRYQLINFTQNSYIRVVATDLCDQQQCPDTGEAPMDPPAGSITGFGDYATGYVTHPDGLYNLEFFRLVNVEVTQNTFEPGVVRADFRVDRLDHTQPTAYGFIAASACNATVIDPTLDYSGNGARGIAGLGSYEFGTKATVTPVENEEVALPGAFAIGQNYPNPFSTSTIIDVELPEAMDVRLEIYNLLGQRVHVLADGLYEAGTHAFRFDARDLPSGTYIYRVTTAATSMTRRMVVVK